MTWDLESIVKEIALQDTTSDQVIKRDIIREVVYKGAGLLTDATMIFPEVPYDGLDVKGEFPSEIDVDYPVAEGAEGKEGRITWTPYYLILEKAEGNFKITDEATLRGRATDQYTTGVKKLAMAIAKKKNINILTAMDTAGGSGTGTGGAWDTNTNYVVSDVQNAINRMLETEAAQMTLADIKKIVVALPIKAWSIITQLTTINNIKMSFKDYLEGQNQGLRIAPFKELSTSSGISGGNDAWIVCGGADSGKHGVLRTNAVPLVEEKRIGAALKYTVRQFFNTVVLPDSSSVSTSSRVQKVTGILGSP